MARPRRTLDGASLEALIDSDPRSLTEIAAAFAEKRLKRKPNRTEAGNARSQIQKMIRQESALEPRTIRLLAAALDADPEQFLKAEQPPSTLDAVLANQERAFSLLESLGRSIDGLRASVDALVAQDSGAQRRRRSG